MDQAETQEQKLILLIDSSAILHRCFHGYPERSNVLNGVMTPYAALYGYMEYVNKVLLEFEFDEMLHILDPDGGSAYRFSIFPEYKGQRPPTDPQLKIQKNLLPDTLSAFQQKWLQMDGVESDDVLGAIAKKYSEAGHLVMVLSPDKDLLQLVVDGMTTVASYESNKETQRREHVFYTEDGVIEKFGVRPDQVADYLAIVGDTSDNIPGVYKAGGKTAQKWLNEYGDIETLITHADEIKGKIGDNLREAKGNLRLYKQLTSLLVDIETPDLEAIEWNREIPDSVRNIKEWIGIPDHWEYNFYEGKEVPVSQKVFKR